MLKIKMKKFLVWGAKGWRKACFWPTDGVDFDADFTAECGPQKTRI
jgi:hypothetical protein